MREHAAETSRQATVLLCNGFQLLDVFGPVELLSGVPGVDIQYAGPSAGPVRSSQGCEVVATLPWRCSRPTPQRLP